MSVSYDLPDPASCGLPYGGWRDTQARAIQTALAAPTRFIGIQAPTGTGKTGIGIALASFAPSAAILTSTKVLQDAYAALAPDLVTDFRGQSNYPCLEAGPGGLFAANFWAGAGSSPVGCDQGPCRVGEHCTRKREGGCLYYDAKRAALRASLLSTSYACWLSTKRYAAGLPFHAAAGHELLDPESTGGTPRAWLVCDEAHHAAQELASHLEIVLTPQDLGGPIPACRTAAAWRSWAVHQRDLRRTWLEHGKLRDRLRAKRIIDLLDVVAALPDRGWVWDTAHGTVRLGPVDVRSASPLLWQDADRVVLMSATLTPAECARLGIAESDLTWLSLPSPFPVRRRPVYVLEDAARLDYRSEQRPEVVTWWLDQIDDILEARADRKGVLHSISYARRDLLLARSRCRSRFITHDGPKDLPAALAHFRSLPQSSGAVFVSPSVTTGVDFPYTDCEYQILVKLPFPNLQHALDKARLAADPGLRELLCMRTLVQMTGRGMRAADDACETFLVDGHAKWFLRSHRALAPVWFLDAVRRVARSPTPPPRLPSGLSGV